MMRVTTTKAQVHSRKHFNRQIPNSAELIEIYEELFDKPNVRLCFIGHKISKNVPTQRIAIVCGVQTKVKKKELGPKESVPPQMLWLRQAKTSRRIPTDIIEMPINFQFRQGAIIGPGDLVVRNNSTYAAVGIAMRHPQDRQVVTTAGHLFSPGDVGERVTVKSGSEQAVGTLVKRVISEDADYALIRIDDPCRILNLYKDRYAIGPPYSPSADDLKRNLRILTPGAGPSIEVTCHGIHGHLNGAGGPSMSGLILTEDSTHLGDSGSCLIDETGSVWGLLVGGTCPQGFSYSAFMSVYIPLLRENAQLI
jgi:hypothetical protein